MPVNVSETFLDLGSGWNWVGYTPQVTLDINTALTNLGESGEFLGCLLYTTQNAKQNREPKETFQSSFDGGMVL